MLDGAGRARRDDRPACARELAAYVLGQLGTLELPAFAGEQASALERDGRRARTTRACSRRSRARSACSASRTAEDWLLQQRDHPDARVREGVAFALGGRAADGSLRRADRALADHDAGRPRLGDVRARHARRRRTRRTLREALAARLDDATPDTRLRGDPRPRAARRRRASRDAALAALETTDADSVYTRHLLNETAAVLAQDDDRFERFT